MALPENGKHFSPLKAWLEFQPDVFYKETERAPRMVIRSTNALLTLYNQGAIRNPDKARDYLKEYTMFYLREAERGSINLYNRNGLLFEDLELETKEAADHALVVFANLPQSVTSPFLPNGFAKKGMLKGPATRGEFLKRIRELEIGVWQIASGQIEPRTQLEAYPPLLRTFAFFDVGSTLPIKLSEDESKIKQREEERFDELFKDIDVLF